MSEIKKDPATMQTAAGCALIADIDTDFVFMEKEVIRLQELAKKVAEIADGDSEKRKAELWTRQNDLQEERPLVFIDPENGWNEIIMADTLKCIDPLARVWEMFLLKQIYWAEEMRDDKVIESYFDVPLCYGDTGWGVELASHGGGEGGAYKVEPAITEYERDLPKVKFPEIVIDHQASKRMLELAESVFDSILQVRQKTSWWWTLGMTWDYINMRGLDNLMMDLVLQPDWVHKTMKLLSDGYLKRLDWLEENGYLSSNTEGTYVGSGGFGWTNQLPGSDEIQGNVKTSGMWRFCESQETIGVSPDMFAEFILPYQLPILDSFGLNCYGCCEPIDVRWEHVKTIPRLRRVSSSPWADKNKMREQLGKDYIISVKPQPAFLAVNIMEEDSARKEIRDVLQSTKGGVVEFLMKDNHTLGGNPHNAVRWVEIVREEIGRL